MQVQGNAEEFVMYGLLHAAVASPSQLAVDMRDVSGDLWPHPFMRHALQVRYAEPLQAPVQASHAHRLCIAVGHGRCLTASEVLPMINAFRYTKYSAAVSGQMNPIWEGSHWRKHAINGGQM